MRPKGIRRLYSAARTVVLLRRDLKGMFVNIHDTSHILISHVWPSGEVSKYGSGFFSMLAAEHFSRINFKSCKQSAIIHSHGPNWSDYDSFSKNEIRRCNCDVVVVECCFMSTETIRLIRDGHLDFHTAPELWLL